MPNSPPKPSITVWGWTLSVFLLLTYLICVGFGLIAPATMHMHRAWAPLLPGFEWLTLTGFVAGALGSFAYGWFIAVLGVPLYRHFSKRAATA